MSAGEMPCWRLVNRLEAARVAKVSPRAQLLERYQQARKPGLSDSAALSEALAVRLPQRAPSGGVHTPPHLRLDRRESYEAEARKALAAQGVYTEEEVRMRVAALTKVEAPDLLWEIRPMMPAHLID
jgi:hypothetical protein